MNESRPLRMTMLRAVDENADDSARMTMFRTLGAPVHDSSITSTMIVPVHVHGHDHGCDHDHDHDHDSDHVVARGSSVDLLAKGKR